MQGWGLYCPFIFKMLGKKNTEKEIAETREEKFKRVASRRVQEVLNKLRLLGNCADKANYSYDEGQVNKIFNTINNELKHTRSRFNKHSKKNKFILE